MADIASREEPEDENESTEDEEEDEDESDSDAAAEHAEEPRARNPVPSSAPVENVISPGLNQLRLSDNEPTTQTPEQQEQDDIDVNRDNDSHDEEESDRDTIADPGSHRRHRPSARRTAPDVNSIVSEGLRRAKKTTERKHHGKKPVTANVLGRQRGSKSKQDTNRTIKDANTF